MEKYVHPISTCSGFCAWREKCIKLLQAPRAEAEWWGRAKGCVRGAGTWPAPRRIFLSLIVIVALSEHLSFISANFHQLSACLGAGDVEVGPQLSQCHGARGQTTSGKL